jgi:DNA segregation ATPase FtsK/SpoIIIE, S-DNA-T family
MGYSLSNRQRRELWAIALFALALLLALSLVPLGGFGDGRYFPSGNLVGVVGRHLSAAGWGIFGLPVLLLPVLPALGGLVAWGRLKSSDALRWTVLVGGIALLLPPALYLLPGAGQEAPSTAGWVGGVLGGVLVAGFGTVGSAVLLGFLFAALSVATVGWNPLRATLAGGKSLGGAAGTLRSSLERRWSERQTPGGLGIASADGAATLIPMPAPEPEVADVPLPSGEPRGERRRSLLRSKAGDSQLALLDDPGDPEAADLPHVELLTAAPGRDVVRSSRELEALGRVLVEKLATFRIAGDVTGVTAGPVVTQFEVTPAPGIKVSRIASLEADLALAMRAPSIRILAPIPGKGAVGVEVPNPEPEMVYFREVLEGPAFRTSKAQLPLGLGKDLHGRPYVADLARMPHLLIAGATGSGKSVCVNTIITSLVYRHSPRTLRLLMVDPKMVELVMYNDLPHLRHPVVTDNQEAAGLLKWAVIEMERRYELLSANSVRNLQDFNKRLESGQVMRTPEAQGEEGDPDRWIYQAGPLPYIVVIIDELADLMMTAQADVERPLALLAQKARAIGIHLILATQRPSVNVITGLIKANFPSRIAFRVSSKTDSRTILDQNGADALLGNGDMLFLPPGQGDPTRIQGAYLSTEETERLMEWYRERAREKREDEAEDGVREPDILEMVRASEGEGDGDAGDVDAGDRDALFREAAELCIQHQGGSTSLLQRRLRIGYGRAARVVDQLHFAGVLGPPDGSKPREVLMDLVQLDQICS